jgi:hypothetical protein
MGIVASIDTWMGKLADNGTYNPLVIITKPMGECEFSLIASKMT